MHPSRKDCGVCNAVSCLPLGKRAAVARKESGHLCTNRFGAVALERSACGLSGGCRRELEVEMIAEIVDGADDDDVRWWCAER